MSEPWRRREDALRRADGLPPLRDDSPVVLVRELEACIHIGEWGRDRVLTRWRWAVESWIDGYIPDPVWEVEQVTFVKEAQSLIETNGLIGALVAATEAAKRPLTETERQRRDQWLRSDTQRRERLEQQRQRRLLRDGHRTLTEMRKLLRGAAPSPLLASTPERSSPT